MAEFPDFDESKVDRNRAGLQSQEHLARRGDGQRCVMIRPGKPKIRFMMLIRKRPGNALVEEEGAIHLWYLKVIELDA